MKGHLLRIASGLFLVALLALAAAGLFATQKIGQVFSEAASGAVSETDGLQVFFLQDAAFDPGAPGSAVILHDLATGGGTLAITDPEVLAAAADRAHFTDDPGEEVRLVVMSILFMSPPGDGTRSPFATLFQDGRKIAGFSCFRLHCTGPEAERDLAGLIEAGRPATLESERVVGLEAARAREAELLADPSVLLVNGSEDIPEPGRRYDGFVQLALPPILHPWEPTQHMDEAVEADLEAELARLLDDMPFEAESRVFADATWSEYRLHRDGEPVRSEGTVITDGYLPISLPRVEIWLDAGNVPLLEAEIGRFDRFARLTPPDPEAVDARIRALLETHGLDGAPGDYDLIASTDDFDLTASARLSGYVEPDVYLSYYRVSQ